LATSDKQPSEGTHSTERFVRAHPAARSTGNSNAFYYFIFLKKGRGKKKAGNPASNKQRNVFRRPLKIPETALMLHPTPSQRYLLLISNIFLASTMNSKQPLKSWHSIRLPTRTLRVALLLTLSRKPRTQS